MSADGSLDIRVDGDVVIARVTGEIDLSNARAIGSLVSGEVPNDASGVVLDLEETTYLDSSGVHLIFDLAERLAERQQRLALAVPADSRIRRVLDLVKIETAAPMMPTAEAAMSSVRAAGRDR